MSAAIETVSHADVEAIAALHARCFDDAWDPMMIRRILAMPGAVGLVARDGGALAGFALARSAADECELLSLAVADDARGRGIGRRLLEAALAVAAQGGARVMFLEVAETNEVALALYRSTGFEKVGRRPDYYELKGGGTLAALTMSRAVPPLSAS
ncbi:MAG: ribosomal protein S18-alanine N-acetyltransferase [Rhodospirillales bacterium]